MKLQEELMELVNDYRKKQYQDWLDKNQEMIKNLKAQMIDKASEGYVGIDFTVFLTDDDKYYLEKWLEENKLSYNSQITNNYATDYVNNVEVIKKKFNLHISWWK